MILASVHDILRVSQRDPRINHLFTVNDELVPLVVLPHGQRSFFELLERFIRVIGLTLHNVGQDIVRFLDLPYDNRFELSSGSFEIEICLKASVDVFVRLFQLTRCK